MSKIAFIFPGQGAQKAGMGKDFYEETKTGKEVFDTASELLGFPCRNCVLQKTTDWILQSIRRRRW